MCLPVNGWCVREYHVDPFLVATTVDDERGDNDGKKAVASPFLAAARLADTSNFRLLFESLERAIRVNKRIWQE
jgi:hypothetical protein